MTSAWELKLPARAEEEGVAVNLPGWAEEAVDGLGYPAVFVTVSGAHLYGFDSVDSDLDLRGVHLLPVREVVGLTTGPETIERSAGDLDLVTHDLAKFCRLLLRRNGYVLEQLLSPLVVRTGDRHAALVALAPGCLTRHHAHHYLGFADTQWQLFGKTGELKQVLYTLRVLLTGLHLMRTGEVLADLRALPEAPAYVPDLIAAKRAGEHRRLADAPGLPGVEAIGRDADRLKAALAEARDTSHLPDRPSAGAALHDLVVDARLAT